MKKALFLLVFGFLLASCSDEEQNEKDSLIGWYIADKEDMPNESDFEEINEAIRNGEVLKRYSSRDVVASYSLFVDADGRFRNSEPEFGRLRFLIRTTATAVQIVDDNTLKEYWGMLYAMKPYVKGTPFYQFYAGPIFNNLAFYAEGTYYTYTREGNKLLLSNGNVYTIVDGALIRDGSSYPYVKYDQTLVY